MTVVAVTPVDKRRCKVLLDEGFALVLYRGEIKKYGIEENRELSEECYQEILRDVLCKRARERVIHLLKNMDRTEEQLRRKLKDGGYPKEAIDYALSFVKERRYVNDESYARRYTECFSERKSRKQIAYDLKMKGIDGEIIARALEETVIDEDRQIGALLEKRGFAPGNCVNESRENMAAARKEYQKMAAFLARKGFSWEAIRRAMGEMGE